MVIKTSYQSLTQEAEGVLRKSEQKNCSCTNALRQTKRGNIFWESAHKHNLIKARLVDVPERGAAGQVGQVESGSHGNKAGCHLQDGQQPLCGVGHAVWCLEGEERHTGRLTKRTRKELQTQRLLL